MLGPSLRMRKKLEYPPPPGLGTRGLGLKYMYDPTDKENNSLYLFCSRVPWLYQYWLGGFMLFVVLCPGTPEGSIGSGSGFKASQKTGNGLKSHLTDWEKPGIEPVTPGLQDIGLSPYTTAGELGIVVCGRVPWLYQYWPGGFMLFVVLCPGTPEGSTGSGSDFKASQKTGQRLKVSSDRLGEAGNRTCDPWFTKHRFIPYTTAV